MQKSEVTYTASNTIYFKAVIPRNSYIFNQKYSVIKKSIHGHYLKIKITDKKKEKELKYP